VAVERCRKCRTVILSALSYGQQLRITVPELLCHLVVTDTIMGCGTSRGKDAGVESQLERPVRTDQPVSGEPEQTQPRQPAFQHIYPQLAIVCRDQFNSKYTNEVMHRWRPAEIVQVESERVLVHYVGWAETFDHWVDLSTGLQKIAPAGLLSAEQCKKGLPLTEEQAKVSRAYFELGEPFEPLNEPPTEQGSAATTTDVSRTPVKESAVPEDPDAVFVIPVAKLPDPPKLLSTPAPVIATRRTNTPSSGASDSGTGTSTQARMVPPTVLFPPPAPSALQRPSSAPRRPSAPPDSPKPVEPENPYAVGDMVSIRLAFFVMCDMMNVGLLSRRSTR
jgi:hypothetical protein